MNLQKLNGPLDPPKCQDYHGLRSIRNPKSPVNFVSGHPHNPIFPVDDNRHAITCSAGHFSIDQEVLQLLPAVQSKRAETVARTPVTNRERFRTGIRGHDRHRAIARGCTNGVNARPGGAFGRDDAARFSYSYLSGHWQWIAKGDNRSSSSVSGGSFC